MGYPLVISHDGNGPIYRIVYIYYILCIYIYIHSSVKDVQKWWFFIAVLTYQRVSFDLERDLYGEIAARLMLHEVGKRKLCLRKKCVGDSSKKALARATLR